MIDLFPFSGFTVGVLGLGPHGIMTARSLDLSGADVWAWDDDPARREAAASEGVPLVDLGTCDAREIVSLAVEPGIPHDGTNDHAVVAAVHEAQGEVVSDAELLARAQRDAVYLGITGSGDTEFLCALTTHVMEVAGKDVELGGVSDKPMLGLHPLGLGGTYILLMPPEKLNMTVSITFETAVWYGADESLGERTLTAMKNIFHRQTKPRTAILSVDDPMSRAIFESLSKADEQVVVGISCNEEMPGGIYISGSMLIDDIQGKKVPVTDLGAYEAYGDPEQKRAAAFTYATALSFGIEPRVAMACLQGF
jgi:UDP-N-acetylmuramoylalanine--D-glutamate ligase